MSSTYDLLAGLPLRVDSYSLEGLVRDVSSGFTRKSTLVHLAGGRPMSATQARRAAHAVVLRTLAGGAFTDRALHGEAAGLDPRDRALAKQLAFGTVQRRRTLDFVIAAHADRELDPPQLPGLDELLYRAEDGREIGLEAALRQLLAELLDRPVVTLAFTHQLGDRSPGSGRPRHPAEL